MNPNDFRAPALPRIELWRTLIGLVIIAVVLLGGPVVMMLIGAVVTGMPPEQIATASGPTEMAVLFTSFFFVHGAVAIVLMILHKRGYMTVFGPSRRLRMRHFLYGFLVTIGFAAVMSGVQSIDVLAFPEPSRPATTMIADPTIWALWLLPALGLIFVQSLAEEVAFRGYLLQQLGARFKSPFIWALLPSFLFGLGHFDPVTYGTNAYAYVLNTTISGTLACLVTVRTGNLGAAAGLHFGNNASLVFIGTQGSMAGFSLFAAEADLTGSYMTYSILLQSAVMLVVYLVWSRWMARRDRRLADQA